MLKLKRVLVPLDDSPLSDRALETALSLCEAFGGTLYPLYVRREVVQDRPDIDEAELASNLAAVRGSVNKRMRHGHTLPEDRIFAEVRSGEADVCILDSVREHGIDLVVMGTHGRHGLADWLMGSTTERVIAGTRASVYVLHDPEDVG
jgi:nucleotide-binding universal stress UspA family protein